MTKLTIDGFQHKIVNKYYKWYKNIILKRLLSPPTDDYVEIHHILPKSFGGDNASNNLVALTAKEHYIVHCLLTKFSTNVYYHKSLYAFSAMSMKSKNTLARYHNSRLYEQLKIELSVVKREQLKKLFSDPEFKEFHRMKIKASWHDGSRDAQIEKMKNNSPFKIKEIHDKSKASRLKNNSNPFVISNPMHNAESIKKKVEKTSGKNHYLRKTREYFYDAGDGWVKINTSNGLKNGLDKLGFPGSTFAKMLSSDYIPKTGPLVGIKVKRVINEN